MASIEDNLRIILGFLLIAVGSSTACVQNTDDTVWPVAHTGDFSLDGTGSADAWAKTPWVTIPQHSTTERMAKNPAPRPEEPIGRADLVTRAKVLYSPSGLYFLFQCEDRKLQATFDQDYEQVWWEDVVEIFLWPDTGRPLYFEYQLSPLNHVRMTRHDRAEAGTVLVYGPDSPQTRHATSVTGGVKKSGVSITQWSAEIFIPYEALHPAGNVPPESGSRWRANLYRFDYDTGDRTRWEWQRVNGSNHRLEKFGTFLFK